MWNFLIYAVLAYLAYRWVSNYTYNDIWALIAAVAVFFLAPMAVDQVLHLVAPGSVVNNATAAQTTSSLTAQSI